VKVAHARHPTPSPPKPIRDEGVVWWAFSCHRSREEEERKQKSKDQAGKKTIVRAPRSGEECDTHWLSYAALERSKSCRPTH